MQMYSAVLWKLCVLVLLIGVYDADRVEVSVTEGDSVTLHTNVTTDQHEKIKWYFNDIRIAEINEERHICTDVQCNEGTERFRGRLKLDHETGSLTITDTRTTDSGLYQLEIIRIGGDSEKAFNVTVHSVSVAERDKMKGTSGKEEESAVPDSGLSPAAVTGIVVPVLLILAVAAVGVGVICYRKRHQEQDRTGTRTQGLCCTYTSVNLDDNGSERAAKETSRNENRNGNDSVTSV